MPAKKNILDIYRSFRKRDPNATYAFGDAQFLTFYMADAHRIHEALPEIAVEHDRHDFIRIHKLAFPSRAARLKAAGVCVTMVERVEMPNGSCSYRIAGHAGAEP